MTENYKSDSVGKTIETYRRITLKRSLRFADCQFSNDDTTERLEELNKFLV